MATCDPFLRSRAGYRLTACIESGEVGSTAMGAYLDGDCFMPWGKPRRNRWRIASGTSARSREENARMRGKNRLASHAQYKDLALLSADGEMGWAATFSYFEACQRTFFLRSFNGSECVSENDAQMRGGSIVVERAQYKSLSMRRSKQ
ncbi:hypothetical protein EIP86_003050 [Pleurotus ostreatoroseus]|nr:hypothetical protein EIP86_003050 [Pleurotus ostreatoroseus]